MTQETITLEKMDALLAFLPGFEQPNRTFVRDRIDGVYPIYDYDVEAFFRLVSSDGWLDYHYQPAVAGKLLYDDEAIEQADLDTLKSLLTYCVRGERFSDGLWATLLENGRVQALLHRLQLLRDKTKKIINGAYETLSTHSFPYLHLDFGGVWSKHANARTNYRNSSGSATDCD